MMVPRPWIRQGLRLLPWVVAALLTEVGLRGLWPAQYQAALVDRSEAWRLERVAPGKAALQQRLEVLEGDTAFLMDRMRASSQRLLRSGDPGAVLASDLVPRLAEVGWKLQRVRAEAKEGWAVLDLGGEADFPKVLDGLEALRRSARALRVRRLAVRPGSGGRLTVDLLVASPTEVAR